MRLANHDRPFAPAYSFIVDNFLPGDELYLFGFSRGAYTARTVSAMINYVGVLTRDEQLRYYDKIWKAFRGRDPSDPKTVLHAEQVVYDCLGRWPSANAMTSERGNIQGSQILAGRVKGVAALEQQQELFVEQGDNIVPPTIQVVGVWDTVGALGVPGSYTNPKKVQYYSFFDPMLAPNVRNAFHALALFEDRKDFLPTIWVLPKEEPAQAAERRKGQVLRQTWFQGSHSDVGGGHAWHGLSDVTLAWMISQLVDGGLLNVDVDVAKRLQDARLPWARQPQHPSRPAIAFQATREVCGWTVPQNVRVNAIWRNVVDETATNEHIHHSVVHGQQYSIEQSACFALLRNSPGGTDKLQNLWKEAGLQSMGKTELYLCWSDPRPARTTDIWSQRRDPELLPEAVSPLPLPLWKAVKAVSIAPFVLLSTIVNVKEIIVKRKKIPQANLEPPNLLLLANMIDKLAQQPSEPLYT